jgi:hypothetical protein
MPMPLNSTLPAKDYINNGLSNGVQKELLNPCSTTSSHPFNFALVTLRPTSVLESPLPEAVMERVGHMPMQYGVAREEEEWVHRREWWGRKPWENTESVRKVYEK